MGYVPWGVPLGVLQLTLWLESLCSCFCAWDSPLPGTCGFIVVIKFEKSQPLFSNIFSIFSSPHHFGSSDFCVCLAF